VQTAEGAAFDPATGTNAMEGGRPIPDYNYDAISGVDYKINVAQPVGARIQGLSHPDGTPVADDDVFVLAVNNYRQSGGGGYPAVAAAPVVYDELQEIRQLLIDWAEERGTIDKADFFDENWALTTVTDAGVPAPTEAPTQTPAADGSLAATGVDANGGLLGAVVLTALGAGLWLAARMRRRA
jgi:2',3'-cyclic-nucleotide 2'-phosphodiesterase/3'-nucleotidase